MRIPGWAFGVVVLGAASGCGAATATSGAAVQRVRVDPQCWEPEAGILILHTLIDAEGQYDEQTAKALRRPRAFHSRTLWRLDCRAKTCVGIVIALEALEAGREVEMMDVDLIGGIRIIDHTGRTYTLAMEPPTPPQYKPSVKTITIDLDSRRIEYKKSGGSAEAHGTGSCGPVRPWERPGDKG